MLNYYLLLIDFLMVLNLLASVKLVEKKSSMYFLTAVNLFCILQLTSIILQQFGVGSLTLIISGYITYWLHCAENIPFDTAVCIRSILVG